MNIHHLELFHYAARPGGITEAVRHIPCGIQRPAVSSLIARLEELPGATLFHRRPFLRARQGGKNPVLDALLKIVQAAVKRLVAGESLELRAGG